MTWFQAKQQGSGSSVHLPWLALAADLRPPPGQGSFALERAVGTARPIAMTLSYACQQAIADVPTNWQTAGTWDLDSDNDSDVLWRHNDGGVVTWTMEDGDIWQTQNLGVVSNAWHIRGTGEFDLL